MKGNIKKFENSISKINVNIKKKKLMLKFNNKKKK